MSFLPLLRSAVAAASKVRCPFWRSAALPVAAALAFATARADNGSWAVDANGLWSDSLNWAGGTIADGSGFTATFAMDITANRTVSLDSARTLGNLTFGDADIGTAASWIVNNSGNASNILTLAGGTPTITVNALGAGQSATISGVVAGSAGLIKAGVGTLSLTAANTFTGGITVNGGTLRMAGGGASAQAPSQAIVMNGGTFFADNAGGSNNKTWTMASLAINSGANTFTVQRATGLNFTFSLSSAPTRAVGATVNYEVRDAAGVVVTNPTNPFLNAAGVTSNTSEQGTFINDASGVNYGIWNSTGTGSMRSPVYGTTANFSNATSSLAGNSTTNNQVTSSITGQATASVRTIKFGNSSTAVDLGLADDSTLTLSIGGLLRNGGGASTISGVNASIATNSNVEYVFNAAASGDSLNINVPVTANGTNALTKAGLGTVTLGGANTYTGDTYVTSGTLVLADDAQMKFVIGSSGVNNTVTGTGILNLNGDFVFDLTAAGVTIGDSWTIVNVGSLTETYGASFSVVGFTENSGVWTAGNYQFSELTGVLSVVPEPGSLGLVFASALGSAVWLRRIRRQRK